MIKQHKQGCMANVACLVIHTDGVCPGPYGKCTCDDLPLPKPEEKVVRAEQEWPTQTKPEEFESQLEKLSKQPEPPQDWKGDLRKWLQMTHEVIGGERRKLSDEEFAQIIEDFISALKERAYLEGRNDAVGYLHANGWPTTHGGSEYFECDLKTLIEARTNAL